VDGKNMSHSAALMTPVKKDKMMEKKSLSNYLASSSHQYQIILPESQSVIDAMGCNQRV